MGIAFQRLVVGLFIFVSCIASIAAKAHAYPAAPDRVPYAAALEIAQGSIAARGESLQQMLLPSGQVARLVRPVAESSEERRINYVQTVVGRTVAWRSDIDLYGRADRWADPRETLARRAGDCEDIAILKLAALASLGFPNDRLALVVGRDTVRGDHAIAAVRSADGWRLLDDDGVVRAPGTLPRFEPVYSLVDGRAFLHGKRRRMAPAAE